MLLLPSSIRRPIIVKLISNLWTFKWAGDARISKIAERIYEIINALAFQVIHFAVKT